VLDHVALEVADLARAARFYDALMRPLGGRRIVDAPDAIGYGRDHPELWIMRRAPNGDGNRHANARNRSGHVAISAAGRRAVDAAHHAGLAAGGRDGGAPAARPSGRRSRYSGYLLDPDGAWLELVTRSP
jgi:catechol 2,3-dioxygenase-like lactoylglutathione lyase family enzyme